jgi:hypothetical protein
MTTLQIVNQTCGPEVGNRVRFSCEAQDWLMGLVPSG